MPIRTLIALCLTLPAVASIGCGKEEPKTEPTKDADAGKGKDASASAKKDPAAGNAAGSKKKIAKASNTGAAAAKAKQKSGDKMLAHRAEAKKAAAPASGLTCDGTLDGVAWCDSETEIVFCADGDWFALDCGAIDEDSFCGTDVDTRTVDCYVDDDAEELVAAAVLDAMVEEAVEDAVEEAVAEAVAEEVVEDAVAEAVAEEALEAVADDDELGG